MLAASRAAGGDEACGLLFGTPATQAFPARIAEASVARNVAADPARHFEIDPADLFDAMRRDRAGPARLVGVWHSHPNGRPEPSARDAAGVVDESWFWLIVAGERIGAWLPGGGGFRRVPVLVDGGKPAILGAKGTNDGAG